VKQLRLNLRSPTENDVSASERVKAAAKRKQAATETLDEAWQRIFAMKNTPADIERLREVKRAMDAGVIGRHPQDAPKRFSKAEALRLWRELAERQREQKIRELVEKTPANYRLITNEASFLALLDALEHEPIIAVDTETTGVDVYEDKIVGVSLTLPRADLHVYIPVLHDKGEQLASEYVLSGLKPVLENESIGKVLHNAKFDIHIFMSHGVNLRGLKWDTMVAMHLLNENEESFALKNLATKYLNEPSDTYEQLFGKEPFNEIPLDVALVYAAKDTQLTWRLYEFQRKHFARLPKLLKIYEEIENPIIDVSIEMERAGFVLDVDYAKKLSKQLNEELEEIEQKLREHFGDINFNSPAQLSQKFFDELKLDRKLPPNWKKSTDVKTLKILAKHHPGIELMLQYREKTKLLGTYIDALPEQVKADGRVHGNFNQAGTVTGRFSSNNPNLQNQPKFARKLFVAPPGQVILSGDFSQQEPRLLAHFTGEEVLINAYLEGKDLYSTAASELFGLPIEECGDGSKWRKMMKVGILAVMYGTGPKTLASQLDITVAEAEAFIKQFYARYPKVKAWIDGNIAFARKHGYVEMLYGRKRRLPTIKSRDDWERYRAERQCTNAIIQGSAAIQTKLTMIELQKLCRRKGWTMAFSVHDEVAVYANEDLTIEDVKEFENVMINTVKLKVPNKTDIEISRRWGEGLSVKEWFEKQKEESA
jgi:DNA polymerase I